MSILNGGRFKAKIKSGESGKQALVVDLILKTIASPILRLLRKVKKINADSLNSFNIQSIICPISSQVYLLIDKTLTL